MMFDPFYLIFPLFAVALGWLVYRDAKAVEQERLRQEFIHRPGGNRTFGERIF